LAHWKQGTVLSWLVTLESFTTGVRRQPVALYHPCVQMGMLQSRAARGSPTGVSVCAAKLAWLE